jgi:hypothetical protein
MAADAALSGHSALPPECRSISQQVRTHLALDKDAPLHRTVPTRGSSHRSVCSVASITNASGRQNQ